MLRDFIEVLDFCNYLSIYDWNIRRTSLRRDPIQQRHVTATIISIYLISVCIARFHWSVGFCSCLSIYDWNISGKSLRRDTLQQCHVTMKIISIFFCIVYGCSFKPNCSAWFLQLYMYFCMKRNPLQQCHHHHDEEYIHFHNRTVRSHWNAWFLLLLSIYAWNISRPSLRGPATLGLYPFF